MISRKGQACSVEFVLDKCSEGRACAQETDDMKQMQWIGVLMVAALFLSGCVNQGTSKDLTSGLEYSYKGLSIDGAQLMVTHNGVDSEVNAAPVFSIADEPYIVFKGLHGFTSKDGKYAMGLDIAVKDATGKTIISKNDIVPKAMSTAEYLDVLGKFNPYIKIGNPMKLGETYTWTARIYDKYGEGEITTSLQFTVQ